MRTQGNRERRQHAQRKPPLHGGLLIARTENCKRTQVIKDNQTRQQEPNPLVMKINLGTQEEETEEEPSDNLQ